jgi:hypothetical protein
LRARWPRAGEERKRTASRLSSNRLDIELFDMPPPHSQLDAYDANRQKLFSTFLELVTML